MRSVSRVIMEGTDPMTRWASQPAGGPAEVDQVDTEGLPGVASGRAPWLDGRG